MIGTEKQIAYARKIMRGASAHLTHLFMLDMTGREYFRDRLLAIKAIEAIDAGRMEEVEKIQDFLPRWVELVLEFNKEENKILVKAGEVIENLKEDFYLAIDQCLIDQDGNPLVEFPPIKLIPEENRPEEADGQSEETSETSVTNDSP